jgi:radical SAM superfamily enzyme YgiQ (UPF0313 family)
MKIALISPRTGMYRYGTGAFSFFLRYAPLNMATLAALVPEKFNARITIYDESVEKIHIEKVEADLVGLTGITGVVMRSYDYAKYFRARGIPVVIGGPHATLMPEEAKQHADAVVVGHGYETWPQLLEDFSRGQMREIYYPPERIDFRTIPFPDKSYFAHKPFITLNSAQAVFGCPHQCEFCVTPVICRGRYEHRPISDVVAEVKRLSGRYLAFLDPSPVENIAYSLDLYKALKPLKKRWGGLATTRIVDEPKLMDAMAESGCYGLLIGFESVSQETNRAMSKGFNQVDKYFKLVRELHARGIAIMGCFVHGLDTDGAECFQETLDFVREAAIDLPRFTICTPFPGTPLFKRLKQEKRILTENWTLYDAQHVVFQPKRMSVEQLTSGHQWLWNKAYTWGGMFGRIMASRNFLEYILLANLGYRMYAHGHKRFSNAVLADDWKI